MQATSRGVGAGGPATDDLPRTLRREREARERAGQLGGQLGMQSAAPGASPLASSYVPEPAISENLAVSGNTITDIRVPFVRLMLFCFKLVFAAVPALILLGIILWTAGHLLMTFFPWLVKLQILIRVP